MLNRRMPNGTYGGVRGERKSPLLDLFNGKISVLMVLFLLEIRKGNTSHGMLS